MNKYGLPVLIIIMSVIYIFFIPSDPQAIKILFKLIPMWLIIFYAYQQTPFPSQRDHKLIWTGLFFCMLGDGLLIWFVVGLSAFLIGHLFYMWGFLKNWRYSKLRAWTIVPIIIYGTLMGWKIVDALILHNNEALVIPVLLYVTVISLMMWSAIMTGNKWAIIGSILFTISDSILSWNLFVSDIRFSGPLIMTTYYAAQLCIAYSIRTLGTNTNGRFQYENYRFWRFGGRGTRGRSTGA